MFPTKSAQLLRNLFAAYHEPTGLSTQQTQKLLEGLRVSFRRQLEREYGRSPERAAAAVRVIDADHPVRHSAATLHLKSVLSNPLFSYDRQGGPVAASGISSTKRDPMDVFDHAVAKGMMNLGAATGCMTAKRHMLSRPDSLADMSDSQTAVRVLSWLKSTGAEAELGFLDNQAFIRALAPLLIAEGLESPAWEWLSRTLTDSDASWDDDLRVKRAAFLLAQMVRVKSQPRHGDLDAAITTILDAEQLFRNHPLLPRLLVLPWRSVSWLSTVESFRRTTPSEKMFDAHMATAELLPRTFDVETAHLHLYHPTHPDHRPALLFFEDKEKLHTLVQRYSLEKPRIPRAKGMGILSWIAFLGHDTVTHLIQSGRKRDAIGVTNLLRAELAGFSTESLAPT